MFYIKIPLGLSSQFFYQREGNVGRAERRYGGHRSHKVHKRAEGRCMGREGRMYEGAGSRAVDVDVSLVSRRSLSGGDESET